MRKDINLGFFTNETTNKTLIYYPVAKNANSSAKLFLNSGVTTARENGAKNNVGFALQKAIRLGITDGPDMVVCGRPITITGGHMGYCGSEADGLDEIKKETRKLIKQGADFIKIMATGGSTITSDPLKPSYTSEEMQLIVEEAHRVDKLTAAHCSSIKGIENALEAGVDMIIHCIFEFFIPHAIPRAI